MKKRREHFSGYKNKKAEKREKVQDTLTPMDKRREEVIDFFKNSESCVLVAHTGAGKTTRGPEYLLEALGHNAKIAVTVPRRGIATSVATYVAERTGHTLGKEVGYQIRHDAQVKKETALNFMTDGIMLRKIMEYPLLEHYDAVMVDEAHERSLNIDITMGLLRQAQQKRKEAGLTPLKIVISSATIEKEKFAKYFETEAVMEVEGKMFPVEEFYMDNDPYEYTEAAAEQCQKILESGEQIVKDDTGIAGDILVFMPGKEEIRQTIQEIQNLKINADFEVLPFHSQIPASDRDMILRKRGDKRRIVVSTNVAEAGVTIPDIGYVVDSGLIRENEYDPETGIESLATKEHSLAGLKQRKGRAGRLAEGRYYGLYNQKSLDDRKAYSDPEIKRSNLSNVVLTMKKTGIDDIHGFDFLDHPGVENINAAIETLKILGALDEADNLTTVGEKMADLPTDPEIGRALVAASEYDCSGDIATIAAFLAEKSVFVIPRDKRDEARDAHRQFQDPKSDFLSILNVWNAYNTHRDKKYKERDEWARNNFLSMQVLQRVKDTRSQFLSILKRAHIPLGKTNSWDNIGKSIAAGFIPNLMISEGKNRWGRSEYTPVHESDYASFIIDNQSSVDSSPDICIAKERRRVNTKKGGSLDLLSMVQSVNPDWIPEIAPQMVEKISDEVAYDPESDTVSKHTSCKIKGTSYELPAIVERTTSPNECATAFAYHAVEDPDGDFAEENKHNFAVANKYNTLHLRYGGDIEENEYFSGEFDTEVLKQLYATVFKNGQIYSMEDLNSKGISLQFDLSHFVPEDIQELIEEENPESIVVDEKEYSVAYEKQSIYGSNQLFHASIAVTENEIFTFDTLPKLPSGREIMIRIPGYLTMTYNLHTLKEKVRDHEIDKRWREWREKHPTKELHLNFSDPEFSIPKLPEKATYAKDPITNEEVYAYPALRRDSWGEYNLQHYQSKEEAERIHSDAITHIEELAREAEHQRKRESILGELHKIEEDITHFMEDSVSGGEKPWLKYNCPHDLIALRDEVREAIKIANKHAPDAENIPQKIQEKIADISAIDTEHRETQSIVNQKIRDLLEESQLSISSETSLYNLLLGEEYITSAVKERISFMKYEFNSSGDRYAVAAELSADNRNNERCLVAQLIVRDDGLIRVVTYDTDDMGGSEHIFRSHEDGTNAIGDTLVWTGELLNPDSFVVKDYNIAPVRMARTVSNRKSGRAGRQRRQRRPSREFEDAITSGTIHTDEEGANPIQAAFQKALHESKE